MRLRANTIAALAAALLCGCTPPDYTKVQDAGIFAAVNRFRFEFGEPEAGKTHTFNFTAPSGDRFCFGLEKKNLAAPPDVDNIRASMTLTGVRETVFDVSLPLSQWKRQGVHGRMRQTIFSTSMTHACG